MAGLIGGFILASGNMFTYFNHDYRALLLFNLQYVSTIALIYFAWRQYQFTQLEHADAEFQLEDVTAAFAAYKKEDNEIFVDGNLVNLNFIIRNVGNGYAELIDFEDTSLIFISENPMIEINIIRPDYSKKIHSRIAPGESIRLQIEEFGNEFKERGLNESIGANKDYEFENFRVNFFSDKGRHELSTQDIQILVEDTW